MFQIQFKEKEEHKQRHYSAVSSKVLRNPPKKPAPLQLPHRISRFPLQSQHKAPALNRPLKWSTEFTPFPSHWVHTIAPFPSQSWQRMLFTFWGFLADWSFSVALVLTARDLQRRETGRSEISAGGDALRTGGDGAAAARLAVAAIESSGGVRGGSGSGRGRRDGRPARAGSRPILIDKERRDNVQFSLQIDTWRHGYLQHGSFLQVATIC